MTKILKKTVALFVVLLTLVGLLAVPAGAASVKFYQTSKADVPIWTAASSSSTKAKTISAKGTVLKVTGSTTNSAGNVWYQLSDGYWVYSGNVTSHGHSYSGGICTGNGCGYEWPYSTKELSGTFLVTNSSGAKIWSRPYSHNSTHVRTAAYNSALTITHKTTNQEDNVWYKLSDGNWVFSGNVAQQFTIRYNANGGKNAPGDQYALAGQYLKLSSAKPSRVGYQFQGWGTKASDTSVDYKPGTSYKFTANTTLYAIWKECSHDYVGGICDKCGYEYPLSVKKLSATFVVTNSDGAKIWDRPYSNKSTHMRTESKSKVLTVTGQATNAEENLWYRLSDGSWVYSGNVTQQFTIRYDANGGTGEPEPQTVLKGEMLKISSVKPTRVGYRFLGWSASASATESDYDPGKNCLFVDNRMLYAVWKKCDHKYTGGVCDACKYVFPISVKNHKATYVVTNEKGAKIWDGPYSEGTTTLRTAAHKEVLSITGQATNAEDNVWYQLADGSWVYSGNVIQRFTVTYDANGGTGAPGSQTVLKGDKLKLSSTKPTRPEYFFQGWGTKASDTSVDYEPGSSHTFKADTTLYAIWKKCAHEYTGGICNICGFEYPLTPSQYAASVIVTNSEGAKIWDRPYSKKSNNVRTEAVNAVLTVTAKVVNHEENLWYRLSDGNWVYAGNVAEHTPACDHSKTKTVNAKAATCTAAGYTGDTVCSACGEVVKKGKTIAAKGHTEVIDKAVAATCTASGKTQGKHCSVCNKVLTAQKTVPPLGHAWDEGRVTIAPTEIQEGEKVYTCKTCGQTEIASIPTLNHQHQYTASVIAPTCTEGGYTAHTCTCGDSYKENEVAALGHSWDEGMVTAEPTEAAEGEKTFTCTTCGETKTETIPVLNHQHKYTAAVTAPTCTEGGYTTHTCACGDSYKDSETAALDHSWDEGKVTKEPTETEMGEKTFTCTTCGETKAETIPVLNHQHKYTATVTAPTCTEGGYTTHTCACGDSYKDGETAALDHRWDEGKVTKEPTETEKGEKTYTCTLCSEIRTEAIAALTPGLPFVPALPEAPVESTEIYRFAGGNRFETAFMAADQMKKNLGTEKFNAIVVTTGTNFADALSGSYLAAAKQAPILLTFNTDINEQVKAYIRANLAEGGTVYILGDEGAVPKSIQEGLEGINIKRLAGNTRFDTNLAILREVGIGEKPVLICTGIEFADSLSAAATELPILLVWRNLTEDQKAFLESLNGNKLYIIGGESAVSKSLQAQIEVYGKATRLGGRNRFETSVMIAETFFENPQSAVLAYAWNFPDGLCGGAMATTMKAPLILTMTKYESQAMGYVQNKGITQGIVLGSDTLISDTSIQQIAGER